MSWKLFSHPNKLSTSPPNTFASRIKLVLFTIYICNTASENISTKKRSIFSKLTFWNASFIFIYVCFLSFFFCTPASTSSTHSSLNLSPMTTFVTSGRMRGEELRVVEETWLVTGRKTGHNNHKEKTREVWKTEILFRNMSFYVSIKTQPG